MLTEHFHSDMLEATNPGQIRSAPHPNCAVCGGEGKSLYQEGQSDRLFGAFGFWTFKKCSDQNCELMWLDPMPFKEDIGKAYVNYYTHAVQNGNAAAGLLKQAYRKMKRGYCATKYGYDQSPAIKILGKFLYLFPLRRGEVDSEIRFLHAIPQGRLLDVGCGSGEWLLSMRELGWKVDGIDFDENAVATARKQGLEVRHGALEQQDFPGNSFDAVTLNHVIEHVPNPIETLAECFRILKPGGKLIVCTPNNSSLSHRIFKQDWRGLEPPRHLHLFSMQSMRQILGSVGFEKISVHPQIAFSVLYESFLLWRGYVKRTTRSPRNWPAWAFARLFNIFELCLIKWKPSIGDCMAAIAIKR
jgi:2-polyprenyl-3-methyl-5-hydroxy-6-metoxy-1,4-benzoquinol methylase